MNVFTPVFNAFRFYANGTEAGAAALAVQDVNISVDVTSGDVIITLRTLIQETGGVDGLTTDRYGLQYSINAGAWSDIPNTNVAVHTDSTNCILTDAAATTNRATDGVADGTGSFVAGQQADSANPLNILGKITASNFTEHVWGFELASGALNNGDTLDFRITFASGAPGMANNVVPRITVVKVETPPPPKPTIINHAPTRASFW